MSALRVLSRQVPARAISSLPATSSLYVAKSHKYREIPTHQCTSLLQYSVQARFASNTAVAPQDKAKSLIDALPGNSIVSKSVDASNPRRRHVDRCTAGPASLLWELQSPVWQSARSYTLSTKRLSSSALLLFWLHSKSAISSVVSLACSYVCLQHCIRY